MKKKLLQIAQQYSLKDIEIKINNLSYNLILSVGFLGEFSSGKSTLINALLGKKILPALERPTTKSIIEIIPSSSVETIEFFEKDEKGELIPIEPINFQEIALGKRDGIGVIKTKSTDIFQEGYMIIDTPGISSLEKTDIDITYGYLPFLDGAIICQDINYGSLTDSIINFLSLPSVKPIVNSFIFVLTKADIKTENAVKVIRENVIHLLIDKSEELGIDVNNIEDKVITVSGLKALEENNQSYIKEFENAFNKVILNRKKSMLKTKETKELIKIGNNIIDILSNIKDNLSFTDDELIKKEEKIKQDIKELEEEKKRFKEKLNNYKNKLCVRLDKVAERYSLAFESIREVEEANEIINELTGEIIKIAENQTKSFMDGIEIPNLNFISEGLRKDIQNIIKRINIGKFLLTSIITAIVIPGGGAADAAQAAGGAVAQKSGEIGKALQMAKKLEKTGKIVKETAEKTGVLDKVLKGLGKVFQFVGEIEKEINPFEYIGNYLKQSIISSKAKSELFRISSNVCYELTKEVESQINEMIFSKLDNELSSKEVAMRAIRKEKLNKMEHVNKTKKTIEEQIVDLKNSIESIKG